MRAEDAPELMLSAEQRGLIRDIVRSVLPDADVRLFGSRVKGRGRPFSDVDLLFVQPTRLEWSERAALRERFEASPLPFLVDLVDEAGLPPGMRERVAAESVPL